MPSMISSRLLQRGGLSAAVAVALLSTGLVIGAPSNDSPADEKPAEKKTDAEKKPNEAKTAGGPELLLPKATTKPATKPAKPALKVSAEARQLLDAIRDAYKDAKSLKLAGTISSDIDMNGEQLKNTADFTAAFEAPLKFRHQTTEKSTGGKLDAQLFGGTGKKLYAFEPKYNYVYTADAPKKKVKSAELPSTLIGLMSQLNPSLLLALVPDASEELMDGVDQLTKVDDVVIDGTQHPALKLSFGKESVLTIAFDPKTHLVRRAVWDRKGYAIARKQQDVNKVEVTIDYTTLDSQSGVKDVDFAWTPPVGARDVTSLADAGGGDASDEEVDAGAAAALVGKPAPDFSLKQLDGTVVKLSDLKGQVIMLDFWATWCGPCRASMPHLDAIYKEFGDQGLKAYAVNLREKDTVIKPFVQKTNLLMPVLLDSDGKVANSFGVSGIPQTVVIDKEGKVVKVTVGSGTHDQIKTAIEEAMK